jgi:hypothetical protein
MAMKPVTGKLRKGGGKGLSGDALVGKVSQATIDSIKKMGMTEALKLAGKNGATAGGVAREFQEGVRRMYGAKRLATAKATYAPKPKAKSADAAKAANARSLQPKPMAKSADAAKAANARSLQAKPKPTTKPAAKPASKNNSNFAKATAGLYGAAALGVLAASKGKGVAAAAKLSPAVASAAKSGIGKALLGTGKNTISPAMMAKYKAAAGAKPNAAKVTVGPKGSFGRTTMTQAKSGLGTPSEYASKAGQSAARSTIKSKSADAARAAANKAIAKKATATASNKRK